MSVHLTGLPGVAFVTDATGAVTLVHGLPITTDVTVPPNECSPALVTDADVIHAAELAISGDYLLPELVTDADTVLAATLALGAAPSLLVPALVASDDTIYPAAISQITILLPAPVASDDVIHSAAIVPPIRTLAPALVTAADVFYSGFVTLVGLPGGPQQKLKPPPKHQDPEVIFAPSMSKHTGLVTDADVIRAPVVVALTVVQPGLVTDADTVLTNAGIANTNNQRPILVLNDDLIYGPLVSMILQPALLDSDDEVGAADVGWQVIVGFTDDVEDEIIFEVTVDTYAGLLPETWFDEETIDTYPFFLQQLEGGVPVRPREGVLKGSIKQTVSLKGSITTRRAA